MREVFTPNAPRPAGHYAQAVLHNGMVYVSGQLPIDPVAGDKRLGAIEEQTEQVLRNVAAILEAAGSGLDKVVRATVYITDIQLWDRVNVVYARIFGEHKPARAVVPVKELHFGFQIEIDVMATV